MEQRNKEEKVGETRLKKETQMEREEMGEAGQSTERRSSQEREAAAARLKGALLAGALAEEEMWQAILSYQEYPLFTSSGLPFQYLVKRDRKGEYSGELVVSRKEGSKTLTKSSVMLAFRKVRGAMKQEAGNESTPFFKGPKAIGQIFGISYLYSIFWCLGLIRVPEAIEKKLQGQVPTACQNE